MAHCEASAIFLFPIDLKLLVHLFLSISLPHAKMQPHLPSNYLIMIFQSFYPERSFVKEVQAKHIQMSCHLHDPSYHHIIALHQSRAHVMPPCELIFNSLILPKISVCEASIFYLAPLWLPIFLGLLLSI